MKNSIYTLLVCCILLTLSTSCRKKAATNCSNFNLALDLQDELNSLSTAAQAYSTDQTTANCQSYKNAYEAYINSLRGLESCARAVGSLAAYNESLNDALAELDTLC